MPLTRGLSLFVFTFTLPALSSAPSASQEKQAAPPTAADIGSPALFTWADFDGDSRLDLAAVGPDGRLQLLANAGEGRFEDVTERVELTGIANAALALWGDYDGDLRLDLFVGSRQGASRLFRNEGDVFVDMSTGSGLLVEGAVQAAHWLDHDGDGRLDLHVVTAQRNELFRGLAGGFFERSELPLAGTASGPSLPELPGTTASDSSRSSATTRTAENGSTTLTPDRTRARNESSPGFGVTSSGRTTDRSGTLPAMASPACVASIQDQANPGSCLQASTTPAVGRLYPISTNLFVAVGGNVGIGTTSPAAKLDVAGTARIADTLTLAPSGDQALNVSTGSIYKAGALFLHTKGSGFGNTGLGEEALAGVTSGFANTASGNRALTSNSTGFRNTAHGAFALRSNTTGFRNTASGTDALRYNTSGSNNTADGAYALEYATSANNTASGTFALQFNTTGSGNSATGAYALRRNTTGDHNTAHGRFALYANTTGDQDTASGAYALRVNTTGRRNIACGFGALRNNTTGSYNIALGWYAGNNITTGNSNIAIGTTGVAGDSGTTRIGTFANTRTFVAGIRGVTTGVANAIPVVVDSSGQLGTISSSKRFKEEIRDMADTTERLLDLRPVVFRYKPEVQAGERPLEYGLIAEEVAEVFPDLVVYDDEGEPFTVKYHLLSSMLLNELKKLRDAHAREMKGLREELEGLRTDVARLHGLEARLAALEAPVPSDSESAMSKLVGSRD